MLDLQWLVVAQLRGGRSEPFVQRSFVLFRKPSVQLFALRREGSVYDSVLLLTLFF